ncbi:hypothetical protein P8935_20675 [Telmatobacter sp. DSM 110680]|uniref:Histone methylation protein DOT1 n=1 Tax=Telmatobacter sp. DSM 110680 TaxID=3036704 RepID=A0AAU7DHV4_9BACT
MRIQFLDELDAHLGDSYSEGSIANAHEKTIFEPARALQHRIETLNSAVYRAIRSKIRQGVQPARLRRWMRMYGYEPGLPLPGLGYDDLDELMSGVLELREPARASLHGPEMVFYQPTPARHILDVIEVGELSEEDVLIDLGSGLGHVPIITSMLTGSRGIGIELESAYINSARDCAERLALDRVVFVQQDARDADLSRGNVFCLYTPFTGTIFSAVLDRLKSEAKKREIRICTLGPCAEVIARETWLTARRTPHADRITCFSSNAN